MRILHVFDRYLSGGFERHFDLAANYLHKTGAEQFCYGGEGTHRLRDRLEFSEVVSGNFTDLSPADVLAQVRAIDRLIKQRDISVVHMHPFMALMPGSLATALAGVPHVITMHAAPRPGDMATEFGALYFETIAELAIPYAAAITAVSEEALEGTRAGFAICENRQKLVIIRNPVHVPDEPPPLPGGAPQALFVSRLDADKESSSRAALDLFVEIRHRAPNWRFAVCGEGDRRRELEVYAAGIGLRDVSWLGRRDDVCALMRQSSLVVGMDRVAIEAMAEARPVVVAGYSGLADFITPANVRRFEAGNYGARGWALHSPAVLAQRLDSMLADDAARRELHAIVRADHGVDAVGTRYRELYEQARNAAPEAWAREIVRVLERSRAETIRDCAWLEELGPEGFSFWPPARRTQLFEIGRQYGQGLRQAEHARRTQGFTIDKLATRIAALETERRGMSALEQNAETRVRLAEERIGALQRAFEDARRAALARDAALQKTTAELTAASARAAELETRAAELHARWQRARAIVEAPPPGLLERILRPRNGALAALEPETPLPPEPALDSLAIEVPSIPRTGPERARTPAQARYDFVVLPIFDYEFRYQRPQQIAAHLARAGHRVYWISPTRMIGQGVKSFSVASLLPNLYEISLQGERVDLYRGELTDANLSSLTAALAELYKDQNILESCAILQFPFWRRLGLALRRDHGARILYDCMDDWQNWPAEPRISEFALSEERALLAQCDVLTVSSSEFVQRHARNLPPPVLIRNAADYAFFRRGRPLTPGPRAVAPPAVSGHPNGGAAAPSQHPPVIGYYGVIAEWFNVETVLAVAKSRPQYSFVFIGAVHHVDISELEALPNVTVLGETPYTDLPGWLASFDAAMIPFRITPLTRAVDPVKLYEYLSQGKPVVATPMPELLAHRGLIRIAEGPEQFAAALDEAVAEPKDAPVRIERTSFAASNTWSVRAAAVEAEIERAFPLVSVIVLTYNSAEFMDPFWDSFRRNTSWPSWELLIADNASTDGTVRLAERFAREDSRVRVLPFAENIGFAAGNNRAAREARGEYLLFLNPDVIVTRGWMSRLVIAAERDAYAGIVTCVTNFAGNETRINVGYRDLAGLESFAGRLAAARRGLTRDIQVAALFCALVPRRVWEEVGELDERFGIGMFEDDDFSSRVRAAGYRVFDVEDCFVHHFGNGSFGQLPTGESDRIFEANRVRYEEKWGRPWQPHRLRPGVLPLEKTRPYRVEAFRTEPAASEPPQIRDLHPAAIRIGEKPNPQEDGSALLVIECMNATPDTEIEFGGRLLRTNYGGPNWVSATIPDELLQIVGKIQVRLVRAHDASDVEFFRVYDEAEITIA